MQQEWTNKPLTQAIAKYIIPQYPYMDKNIVLWEEIAKILINP